jgi:hypothetical protein
MNSPSVVIRHRLASAGAVASCTQGTDGLQKDNGVGVTHALVAGQLYTLLFTARACHYW